MWKFFVILVFFGGALASVGVRPEQAIGVKGYLKCNGKPASGVLVKLYDHDSKGFFQIENFQQKFEDFNKN